MIRAALAWLPFSGPAAIDRKLLRELTAANIR